MGAGVYGDPIRFGAMPWIGSAQTLVALGTASRASVLPGFEKMECLKLLPRIVHTVL
jgi:hypothetical protein